MLSQAYPPVDGPVEAPLRTAATSPQSSEVSAEIPEASSAVSVDSKADVPMTSEPEPSSVAPESSASSQVLEDSKASVLEASDPPPFVNSKAVPASAAEPAMSASLPEDSTYGPLRRRVRGKNGPDSLWRPATLQSEDFAEIMREVVPELIQNMTDDLSSSSGSKRPLESDDQNVAGEPPMTRSRVDAVTQVFSVASLNTQH